MPAEGQGGGAAGDSDAIPSMDDEPSPPPAPPAAPSPPPAAAGGEESGSGDDAPDMDSFDAADNLVASMAAAAVRAGGGGGGGGDEEDDDAALPYLVAREPEDNILRTRTYDVSVSYDKYYQTPRIWLSGYDERRMPLAPQEALADVSHEHARKTVTIDGTMATPLPLLLAGLLVRGCFTDDACAACVGHPHTGVPAVSIHPCRHGAVMKKIADQMAEGAPQQRARPGVHRAL